MLLLILRSYVHSLFSSSPFPINPQSLLGYLLASTIALAGYRVGALTVGGAVAACIVGGTIFSFGGLAWAGLLLAFFVSSSALSFAKASDARKLEAAKTFEKGGKRDAAQVLANGGVAAFISLLAPIATPLLFSVYAGALAAATADTWATEIGVLSKRPPRLITTGKMVPAGTSGGITLLGTGASAAGALFLGIIAAILSVLPIFPNIADQSHTGSALASFLGALFGGFAGSLADSLLGATLQASYWCPTCQLAVESRIHTCGSTTHPIKGLSWLNNDFVNLLATGVGAGTAALVVWWFGGLVSVQ